MMHQLRDFTVETDAEKLILLAFLLSVPTSGKLVQYYQGL